MKKSITILSALLLIGVVYGSLRAPQNPEDYGYKGETDRELIEEMIRKIAFLEARVEALQSQSEKTARHVFKEEYYRVKIGDSFEKIADSVGITIEQLGEMNPEVKPELLRVGQKLRIRNNQ